MGCTPDNGLERRLRLRLRAELSAGRAEHSESAAATARRLARAWRLDEAKAEAAGLAHDLAREWSAERLADYLRDSGIALYAEEHERSVLLHAPAAALLLRREFQCQDEELFEAVRFHTLGRAGLGRLGRLLMIADYVEPARDYRTDGLPSDMSGLGLDEAFCLVLRHKSAGRRLAEPTRAMYCGFCGEGP